MFNYILRLTETVELGIGPTFVSVLQRNSNSVPCGLTDYFEQKVSDGSAYFT